MPPLLAPLFSLLAIASASLDTASFRLTTTKLRAAPLPPRFVAFSIEVASAPSVFLVGGLGGAPRPSFAALLNTLRAAAGDAHGASIRIGGNSADESAWVPAPSPLPVNTTYRITAADLDAYASAVPAWNGTVIVDTTMRLPGAAGAALVVAHATAAVARLGWAAAGGGGLLESVEIGNEPGEGRGRGREREKGGDFTLPFYFTRAHPPLLLFRLILRKRHPPSDVQFRRLLEGLCDLVGRAIWRLCGSARTRRHLVLAQVVGCRLR